MFRGLISALFTAAVIAYGYGIWLFLLHGQDRLPAHADAIVVLAGSTHRLPVALKLAQSNVADTLVVSEDNATGDPKRYALCHGPKPKGYTLLCQFASPNSTRGEAQMIADLVRQKNWKTVVVVTSRYQIYRAHKLIRRCTKVDLAMRYTDKDSWWQKAVAIPLEYAKLVRAEVSQRGC
jgi:uncharacterized SAM-binding protein YcdF (DUF218 family)